MSGEIQLVCIVYQDKQSQMKGSEIDRNTSGMEVGYSGLLKKIEFLLVIGVDLDATLPGDRKGIHLIMTWFLKTLTTLTLFVLFSH